MAAESPLGWKFLLWWVLATNAAWFPGIALGTLVVRGLGEKLAAEVGPVFSGAIVATITATVASMFFGVTQWLVLRRYVPRSGRWVAATVLGWSVGIFVASVLAGTFIPEVEGFRLFVSMAFVAGAAGGWSQWMVIRSHFQGAAWWIPISAVGWAIQFPGALPGLGLMWLSRRTKPQIETGLAEL